MLSLSLFPYLLQNVGALVSLTQPFSDFFSFFGSSAARSLENDPTFLFAKIIFKVISNWIVFSLPGQTVNF